MRKLSEAERAELRRQMTEYQEQRVKRTGLSSQLVGKERADGLDKVVTPILGVIVWFGLKALGLDPFIAFIIGGVAAYLFGPGLAWILRGMPQEPSRRDKNDGCTRK